jgi:hypothetical protein
VGAWDSQAGGVLALRGTGDEVFPPGLDSKGVQGWVCEAYLIHESYSSGYHIFSVFTILQALGKSHLICKNMVVFNPYSIDGITEVSGDEGLWPRFTEPGK